MSEEDANMVSPVIFQSADEKRFEIPLAAAKGSSWFAENVVNEDGELDNPEQPVLLLKIQGDILEKIVDFLNKNLEAPVEEIKIPLQGKSVAEIVQPEWAANFVTGLNQDDLFSVLKAADFLAIQSLIDVIVLKLTFDVHGKGTDEISTILRLPKITPEEDREIRKEHPWLFENEPAGEN